ncbi:MAG: hypothetical protein ACM3SS_16410 [Rhodospirillaceae bacterium]
MGDKAVVQPRMEEKLAVQPRSGALKATVSLIAIAMSLYHMYVAAFGPPEAMIFRGTHLLFALTLVFLLYPVKPGGGPAWRVIDAVMLLASWAFILHIFINYEYVTNRASSTSTISRSSTKFIRWSPSSSSSKRRDACSAGHCRSPPSRSSCTPRYSPR